MNKQITVRMSKLSQSHQSPHFVPDFYDKPVCNPFLYDTTRNRGLQKVQHHRFYIHKWTVQFCIHLREFFFQFCQSTQDMSLKVQTSDLLQRDLRQEVAPSELFHIPLIPPVLLPKLVDSWSHLQGLSQLLCETLSVTQVFTSILHNVLCTASTH